jgi:5-methylthioadenosine/S-adenosylhomocysteine deaminase
VDLLKEADLLICNCAILPMNGEGIIEKGFITIKNAKISYIGSGEASSVRAKRTLDGQGKVALPGLVNCHTHVAMTLFRGIAEDKPFDIWWKEAIWPLEQKLKRSDIYAGALLGCLEMIKSGTTCFADMYFYEDAVAEAVEKSGLRAVLAPGIIEAGSRRLGEKTFREAVKIAQKYHGCADGRINIQLGPHTASTCSPQLLKKVREAASELKVGLTFASGRVQEHGRSREEKLWTKRGGVAREGWLLKTRCPSRPLHSPFEKGYENHEKTRC